MKRAVPALFLTPLLFATSALATGFDLREFSPSSLGTSYAGAAANGVNASTTFFNPALTSEVEDFDLSLGATAILTDSDGTYSATTAAGTAVSGTSKPNGLVTKTVIPSLALRKRIAENWTIGFTSTLPWGMLSKYDNDWVGRYYAIKSEIQTRNMTTTIAYSILPELSVAGGVQVQYVKAYLSKAIDFGTIGYSKGFKTVPGADDGFGIMTANDWGVGYIFGVVWKATPDLTVGASYRSRIAHTVAGNKRFVYDQAGVAAALNTAVPGLFEKTSVHAVIDTPSVATISAKYRLDDQWTLMATADWTGWYSFQSITAVPSNTTQSVDINPMDWKPSWMASVGAEYKVAEEWTLRAGTAYDATPTHTLHRTPGIPDNSRIWTTFGLGYQFSRDIAFSLSYCHMFGGHTNIDEKATESGNALRGNLSGEGSLAVNLIGLQIDYKL
jgi:long-chain fatty acid transport protein